MRKVLLITALFTLIISACASAAPTERPSIMIERPAATSIPKTPIPERPSATPVPETPTPERTPAGPAEEAVIKRLAANLGLQESDISVVSSKEVEFKDSCLDMMIEDMRCAQVITPGRSIVLESKGVQYEYHTSRDGGRVQPVTLALVWRRSGGVAGFCDTLTVFLSGEVFASQCKPQAEGKVGIFADLLSSQEQAQFNDWIARFAETDLDASDPKGVSDRMEVTLKLLGTGSKTPTESEQQALFQFSQNLYKKLAQ
jgi:hypothetical protein